MQRVPSFDSLANWRFQTGPMHYEIVYIAIDCNLDLHESKADPAV